MSEQAPAGWYPQPDGSQRYWDGAAWTEQVTSAPAAPPPPTQPMSYGDPAAPTYATQTPAQPAQGLIVAPKNPIISLVAAFFIPGLGSMINGDVGKGIGILVGYVVSLALTLVLIGYLGVLGFWIWGMIDAYQGAQKWNAKHGILS